MDSLLIDYLDHDDAEIHYQNLIKFLNDNDLQNQFNELKLFLRLLSKISNNHFRTPNFFDKIEKILLLLKGSIMKFFSNSKIYDIFNRNKRIILFLFKEKFLFMDDFIFSSMLSYDKKHKFYLEYFLPEIKKYIDDNNILGKDILSNKKILKLSNEIPEDFEEKRKIGENDDYICELIRKDDIENFIIYVNKNFVSVNSEIEKSIYETNNSLLHDEITYIDYSAFFGSIQIFKYLYYNNAEINEFSSIYSIHGNNPEMIDIFNRKMNLSSYLNLFYESIKCHHNDIVNYFIQNDLYKNEENDFYPIIKSYNFNLFLDEYINQTTFFYFCKYDYISIITYFLENSNIDVNKVNEEMEYPMQMDSYNSPLNIAIKKNNIEIVKLLLNCNDININLKTTFNNTEATPLFIAINNDNIEICKLLLNNKKIDINLKCKIDGDIYPDEIITPLHLAIGGRNTDIVSELLNHKEININLPSYYLLNGTYDYINGTPLYKAIEDDNTEIVEILLNHEKIDIISNNGEMLSYIDYAIYIGNCKIIELLLQQIDLKVIQKSKFQNSNQIISAIGITSDFKHKEPKVVQLITKYISKYA